MELFLFTFGIIAIAMIGLAIGVLVGRKPLSGSCGGNAVIQMCPVCKKDDTP